MVVMTLSGCLAGYKANDDTFALLTRSSLEGWEWGCDFGDVTPTGPLSWRVAAKCAGAGEYEDGSPVPASLMTIQEAPDKSRVTITDPTFFSRPGAGPLSLPSCNLSYEEQLRLELERISKEQNR